MLLQRRWAGAMVLAVCLAGCDDGAGKAASGASSGGKKPAAQAGGNAATAVRPAAQTAAPSAPAAGATGPRWVLEKPRHDFGEVWAGATVRHSFEFKNVGNQLLRITEAKARCSCSVADSYTREVPPGGTGQIPFVLNTANKKHGPLEEYLTLKTNDPLQPDLQIYMVGRIKTVCQTLVVQDWQAATPAELEKIANSQGSFPRVGTNDRPWRVLRMTNTTGAPLALQMNPVGKSRLDTDTGTSMVETPFELTFTEITPSQEWELVVTGKPPFPVGRTTANIVFRTGIPDQPTYIVYASAYNPPRIEIVPQKIVHTAGAKPPNNTRSITFTNNGATPFNITAVSASTSEYTVRVRPLDPAKPTQTIVDVTFPFVGYVPPPYGEVIRIETNDAEHPVIERMVLPTMNPATPRPADKPIQWHPGTVRS